MFKEEACLLRGGAFGSMGESGVESEGAKEMELEKEREE